MLISPLLILGALATVLIISGLLEFKYHQFSLSGIPIRIHVNGTRGKSSVTRLIAAGLRAGGKRTFAKTTGTAPRVIDSKGIDRIIHRLRKPSIGEQVRLLKYFSDEKPDVVVMELALVPAVRVPLFKELDIIKLEVSKLNVSVFIVKLPSVKLSNLIKLSAPPTFQAPSVYQ